MALEVPTRQIGLTRDLFADVTGCARERPVKASARVRVDVDGRLLNVWRPHVMRGMLGRLHPARRLRYAFDEHDPRARGHPSAVDHPQSSAAAQVSPLGNPLGTG
jgi:hypothetical protein